MFITAHDMHGEHPIHININHIINFGNKEENDEGCFEGCFIAMMPSDDCIAWVKETPGEIMELINKALDK